ncbi:replication initiator protein [Blackfly microvirus SF02]|uniref:Replication initiator protein n=1 Tax=Blackfly microvirus SF02 TaxID=2576452 RepID=A0A4P8PJY8_9VIRU|nr:replication initiator protein [Blackfly microvirus SF02]
MVVFVSRMVCYYPIPVWYEKALTDAGRKRLTFKRPLSWTGKRHYIPCGQCVGCRLEKSRQWAVRCMHEKQMHRHSAFVTLTYDPKEMPEGGSLRKRDLQLFMKRLRFKYGNGIRFYACGEYGDEFGRPHYHLLLFNLRFPDAKLWKESKGRPLYTSAELRELWPYGFNYIGEVTFESCAYVARYILKKVTGGIAADHYQVLTLDGEIIDREPEFTVMSRRPGIAAGWFDRYHSTVYDFDSVVLRGKEMRPPRFYDIRFELLDTMRMDAIKIERRKRAILNKEDNTSDRLRVRELISLAKLHRFQQRKFE